MSTKYLINEMPLTVQPTLARLLGLEKAVIIQQIHYALQQPKSGKILEDGERWLWNTYAEWQETYFTWLSVDMVKRYFLQLEKDEILISCQPNKSKFDQTKFYQINYKVLFDLIDKNFLNDSDEKSRSDSDEKSRSDSDEKSRSLKEQIILTNNSTNNTYKKEKIKKESSPLFEKFAIPRWDVDEQIWIEFLQMRFDLKKPLTERGYKNLLSDLVKLPQGFDLNRRIGEAIDRKWQGLIFKEDFSEVKNNGNNTTTTGQNGSNGNGKTTQENPRLTTAEYLESIGANPKSVLS